MIEYKINYKGVVNGAFNLNEWYPTSLSYEEEYESKGITKDELNSIILFLKGRIKARNGSKRRK